MRCLSTPPSLGRIMLELRPAGDRARTNARRYAVERAMKTTKPRLSDKYTLIL